MACELPHAAEASVVVAFQSGEGERVDRTTAYGHPVPLTYYRHRIADVADALAGAGFALHATVRREPSLAHETTPQAFLLARFLAWVGQQPVGIVAGVRATDRPDERHLVAMRVL